MKNNIHIIYFVAALAIICFTSCEHKSGHRGGHKETAQTTDTDEYQSVGKKEKTVVKMTNQQGVYYVPCRINGSEMEFVFDTGASIVTMSLTEALFLYKQGKLADSDLIGTQEYQVADGSIQEGSIIILRKVEVGNRTLKNVKATVVHNLGAPLLLGQSVLAKFGKISIDYNRNEITFE